jgi:hypothetical protein
MNRLALRSIILLLVVGLGVITEGAHSQSGTTNEKTFILLQHDWAEARKKSDMAFLENFYASEFTVGNMNGFESSRAEDLAMFSSGDMKPAIITDSEMKVTIYGQRPWSLASNTLRERTRANSGSSIFASPTSLYIVIIAGSSYVIKARQ